MDILHKFENGVHSREDCGTNKNGYAAIGSVIGIDLHRLHPDRSSPCLPLQHKKSQFSSLDSFAYILSRNLMLQDTGIPYILFVPSTTHLVSSMGPIIDQVSSISPFVVVRELNDSFEVSLKHKDISLSLDFDSKDSLSSFLHSSSLLNDACVLAFPSVSSYLESILSEFPVPHWCTPCFGSQVFVSEQGEGAYFHNSFPWSRPSSYAGFTIGSGKLRRGSSTELESYIGSFNYYQSMISCVPFGKTCVDCTAMVRASKALGLLTERKKSRHSHSLSSSSVDALKELQKIVALPDFDSMVKQYAQ